MALDPNQFESTQYRLIGPHRGGRVVAVCGVAQDRDSYYFASTGGVWKSDDAGTSWHNVSVGYSKHACFERRSLAYAVDSAEGRQVEASSVGQHHRGCRYQG